MTMKKYLKKRIIPAGLSLILIIMTVISIMPINVSAEDSLNVIEISRVNELTSIKGLITEIFITYTLDFLIVVITTFLLIRISSKYLIYYFFIKKKSFV